MSKKEEQLICAICGKPITDDPYGHNPLPVAEGRCCTECSKNVVIPTRMFLADFVSVIENEIQRGWYIGSENFKKTYSYDDFNDFEFDVEFDYNTSSCYVEIRKKNKLVGFIGTEPKQEKSPSKIIERTAVKLYDFLKKNSK